MSEIVIDKNNKPMQIGAYETSANQEITTAVVFDANYDKDVRIIPRTGDADIEITESAVTPTAGSAMYINGAITTRIPAGWYIGASSTVNVVPLRNL